jgi:hypothetical protein
VLAAFRASSEFLAVQTTGFGAAHPLVVQSQKTELMHLTQVFRHEKPDRADITSLLAHIQADTTEVFTKAQKDQLMEVASLQLQQKHATDVDDSSHGSKKMQTHLYTYNYYSDDSWSVFGGTGSYKIKFNKMSKDWLAWGLRFPSSPTFRIGLATIIVASKTEVTPTHALDLMKEFNTEFKVVRDAYPGDATLKVFPVSSNDFKTMYPAKLADDVRCREDINKIREASDKRVIPCRINNSSISPRQAQPQAHAETSREQLMRGLLDVAMGQSSGGLFSGLMTRSGEAGFAPRQRTCLAIQDQASATPLVSDAPKLEESGVALLAKRTSVDDHPSVASPMTLYKLAPGPAASSSTSRIDNMAAKVKEHLALKHAKSAAAKKKGKNGQRRNQKESSC